VLKTLETAAPGDVHEVKFYYGMRVPNYRLVMLSPARRALSWTLAQGAMLVNLFAPRQGNQFAWLAVKTGKRKPWMDPQGSAMRRDYQLDFDPGKYRGMH